MRNSFIIGVLAGGALAASTAHATINFTRTASDVAVGSTPLAVASGDLDGDGKADLVTANNDSGDVSVLYGNGDGTFPTVASLPVSDGPAAVALGDFNGDGKPDIVVADDIDSTVSVMLNQGNRSFGAAATIDTGSSPEGIVVGDFNHDGKLDVATADNFDDTVTVLLGLGDGTFFPGTSYDVGSAPFALVAVDLDNDGNLDLVVANTSGGDNATGTLTVLMGTHDGTFTAQPEITSTAFDGPAALVSADFDGNGKPDIAVANQGNEATSDVGNSVVILLGNGSGGFQILQPTVPVGSLPTGVVAADFDGDGKVDLATSNNFDDNVSVLTGLGNGSFNPKVDFSVAPPLPNDAAPSGLVAADFNGDTKPDIATANEDDDAVTVLLNSAAATVCAGDCDGSGDVTVNELITLVNIDLGNSDPSACPSGIPNGATVDITLIITAVNNALGACPAASAN